MAKTGKITTERISEFYGLITNADLTNIPKTMSPDCRNVRPMLGGLKSRLGSLKDNSSSYNEPIKEIFILPAQDAALGQGSQDSQGLLDTQGWGDGESATTGSESGSNEYIFIVTEQGDIYESPRDVYLWAQVPSDADDDRLFPHVQLDNNSDLSSPFVDVECKTDRSFWEYVKVSSGETWAVIPDLGIPTAVMTDIRVNGTAYRVRYFVPGNTTGLSRGTNYMRFRFWDGLEYSTYSAIKTVYI